MGLDSAGNEQEMSLSASIDLSQFQRGLQEVMKVTSKTLPEQLNQRSMNVAVRCYSTIEPQDVAGKRKQIKAYMDQPIAVAIKQNKSGKNKGKFRAKGKKYNLLRKHLIAQALNRKAGKKGLYGAEMIIASARLSRMSQVSVGYVRSIFIPVIRGMWNAPGVKNRPKVLLTYDGKEEGGNNVARWPGSAGGGKATPAKEGMMPHAVIEVSMRVDSGQEGKVLNTLKSSMQDALNAEGREMIEHTQRQLQKQYDAIYAKAIKI